MKSTVDHIIKDLFTDLQVEAGKLSESQLTLVKSIKKYFDKNRKLSEKQLALLLEIRKYAVASAPQEKG